MATISVAPGNIGIRTDRTNLLTYALTGTMTTQVTEKVNGVTVDTKTLTSGQSTTVSLDQAEWDAVRYGKYATTSAGLNTLEVSMGTEKWTYTFDKRNGANDDLLSVVKSVQDAQSVYLPAVKSKLASAITSKGGSATGADSWDTLETAVNNIVIPKKANGTATSSLTSDSYMYSSTTNMVSGYPLRVTGLNFTPTEITVFDSNNALVVAVNTTVGNYGSYPSIVFKTPSGYYESVRLTGGSSYVRQGEFSLPTGISNTTYKWYAKE